MPSLFFWYTYTIVAASVTSNKRLQRNAKGTFLMLDTNWAYCKKKLWTNERDPGP